MILLANDGCVMHCKMLSHQLPRPHATLPPRLSCHNRRSSTTMARPTGRLVLVTLRSSSGVAAANLAVHTHAASMFASIGQQEMSLAPLLPMLGARGESYPRITILWLSAHIWIHLGALNDLISWAHMYYAVTATLNHACSA